MSSLDSEERQSPSSLDRNLGRMMGKFYRPWYRRPFPWLVLLLVLVGAGRVALTPLADRWARQALSELANFKADYRDLEIFSFPPVAVLDGVTVEDDAGNPVLGIERLEVHTTWSDVLRATVLGAAPSVNLRVSRPRVTLTGDAPVFLADELRGWLEGRREVHVALTSIEDGDILVGAEGSARPETWMSKVRASIQRSPSDGSATMRGTAALLGSGETSFTLGFPASDSDPATGELQVSYLSLADLYLFLDGTPPARDKAPGTLAVGARFKLEGSVVSGLLRTSTAGLEARDLPPRLLQRLRTRLSAAAPFVDAHRRRTSDPAEFALRGTVTPASTGTWLKSLSATRAFFVEGVGGAVAALPDSALESPQPAAAPEAQASSSAAAVIAGSNVNAAP